MNDDKMPQEDSDRDLSRKRFTFLFILITFCIVVLAGFMVVLKICYPSNSETIIRQAAASQLNMDPNKLSVIDFEKIESLDLLGKKISDVRMLKRFKNLKTLSLSASISSNTYISRCTGFLKKLGIPGISRRTSVDLKSLGELSNLKVLILQGPEIKNIEPLALLKNVEFLYLIDTQVESIKPLSNLTNLKELNIWNDSLITDLEPVKKIKNLNRLHVAACKKIQDTQINDLRKALPNTTLLYKSAYQVDVRLISITPAELQ